MLKVINTVFEQGVMHLADKEKAQNLAHGQRYCVHYSNSSYQPREISIGNKYYFLLLV